MQKLESRSCLKAVVCLAAMLGARSAAAQQNFEVMAAFPSPDPALAFPLLAGLDGSLYGMTPAGGIYAAGSIFALAPDGLGGFTYEDLYSFSGPDGGGGITGVVVGADGRFYGAARGFFRLDLARHLTELAAVPTGGTQQPSPLTPASDGSLYGVTLYGGAHNNGTVFRLDLSGAVTTLHDLGGPNEGAYSYGGLVEGGDGRLYGTTSRGGAPDNPGTVFAIDPAGNFSTLHVFGGAEGVDPVAGLALGSDGALYGTTAGGASAGYGTAFRITTGGALTTLHVFLGTGDGASPRSRMVLAPDGNLYGTTSAVPLPEGEIGPTLFRIDSGGALTTIPTGGELGGGPLTVGADGNLYVTTGASVFRVTLGGAVTVVYTTPFPSPLTSPYGGLLELPGGGLFGLSRKTVISDAIFQLDFSGHLSTFHWFDEALVNAPLLHLDDGSFYGTTVSTFSNQNGGVFRVDAAGIETSLHEFSGSDGFNPRAGLTVGPSGELWGTTQRGGDIDEGTIFKIDSAGTFTSLYDFDGNPAYFPETPLSFAADGNFYGIAGVSFFRVDPLGAFASLHDFTSDAAVPKCLIQGADGNFYGTMGFDFPFNGSIFRMDSLGALTPLYTFPTGVGSNLTQAGDASFYGVMAGNLFAQPPEYGSVFHMDTDGNVTTVHAFDGSFGGIAYPSGPLLEASDGNFYGAAGGGLGGNGAVYRLMFAAADPTLTAIEPPYGRAAGGAAPTIRGTHFRGPFVGVTFGGVPAVNWFLLDQATLTAVVPPLSPGAFYDVTFTNSDATSVTLPGAWFADFTDVPGDHLFHDYIETVFRNGITAGCGAGVYCPTAPVTRAQMAVFLLKAEHGSGYLPPSCTGRFLDVACPGAFAVDWIEQLAAENITAGCGDGTNYCPGTAVTRQQMAVFLLKTEHGSGYGPPACAQLFADVPCPSPFADWIEQLAAENITGGCGGGNYCPSNPNTRGQMATFLSKTFSLP